MMLSGPPSRSLPPTSSNQATTRSPLHLRGRRRPKCGSGGSRCLNPCSSGSIHRGLLYRKVSTIRSFDALWFSLTERKLCTFCPYGLGNVYPCIKASIESTVPQVEFFQKLENDRYSFYLPSSRSHSIYGEVCHSQRRSLVSPPWAYWTWGGAVQFLAVNDHLIFGQRV